MFPRPRFAVDLYLLLQGFQTFPTVGGPSPDSLPVVQDASHPIIQTVGLGLLILVLFYIF